MRKSTVIIAVLALVVVLAGLAAGSGGFAVAVSPVPFPDAGQPDPVAGEETVVNVVCAREIDAATLTWDTVEPTSCEGEVEWSTPTEPSASTWSFSDGLSQHHSIVVPAPDPLAVGWGYVVSSGGSVPFAPASFVVPPAGTSGATDLPPDTSAPQPVPVTAGGDADEMMLVAVTDPGEPDSLANPRRFTAGGPPVTGYFQNDYDTDYFSFTVPPAGYPIEVEFESFPNLVLFQIYSPMRMSMWFNGPRISASYPAPYGTYPFSMSSYGPATTEQYTVTGYLLTGSPDQYEPNAFSQPTPWPADSETVTAYIQYNGDSDYYWVDLEAGKTVNPFVSDSYLLGPVTISWRSGAYWYSRDLRSGPFTAPVTTRYVITVGPRSYGYGITASCAHMPYTMGLGGLYPPAPTIDEPTEDSTVAPLQANVAWTFVAPDGSTQTASTRSWWT